jgi:hypothetical protein
MKVIESLWIIRTGRGGAFPEWSNVAALATAYRMALNAETAADMPTSIENMATRERIESHEMIGYWLQMGLKVPEVWKGNAEAVSGQE